MIRRHPEVHTGQATQAHRAYFWAFKNFIRRNKKIVYILFAVVRVDHAAADCVDSRVNTDDIVSGINYLYDYGIKGVVDILLGLAQNCYGKERGNEINIMHQHLINLRCEQCYSFVMSIPSLYLTGLSCVCNDRVRDDPVYCAKAVGVSPSKSHVMCYGGVE